MPIYEFYCKKCNTVFKFYSRTIDTTTLPKCPACKRVKLERIFSSFATLSKRDSGDAPEAGMPDIDETKLEKAVAMLEREVEGMDENDPTRAADLMRRLSDAVGISLGEGMEEALARMERGEDPDKIEEELGDLIGEESFQFESKKKKGSKKTSYRPKVDETLYEF